MHGLDTYDYGARQYNPIVGRWDRVDPLVEKKPWQSPYVYGRNNPIRYVDPDGQDDRDKIVGYIIGTATNIIPFTGAARDLYTPTDASDYNTALQNTDNTFLAVGEKMSDAGKKGTAIGLATASTGGVIVLGSGGTASIAGAPTAVAGVTLTGTSAAIGLTGSLITMNASSNKSGGYDRGNRTGASKNEKHGDGGRSQIKADKHLSNLHNQLANATSKKEKKKLKTKIKHIEEDVERKRYGEEHSRSIKR